MYPTKYNKERPKQQHCPTCNAYVKYSSRYPTYICKRCMKLITDKQGKAVDFFNTDQVGRRVIGLYTDTKGEYFSSYCYVKETKLQAQEAYFGGIVIFPVPLRKRKKKEDTNPS